MIQQFQNVNHTRTKGIFVNPNLQQLPGTYASIVYCGTLVRAFRKKM